MYRSTVSWRLMVSFTLRPLYSRGNTPKYPLDRKLGGPQSQPGRSGEEKILDPTRTRTPTPWSSSPQPVAIATRLSRLSEAKHLFPLFVLNPAGCVRAPVSVPACPGLSQCPCHFHSSTVVRKGGFSETSVLTRNYTVSHRHARTTRRSAVYSLARMEWK
jgi:hypothetical protein